MNDSFIEWPQNEVWLPNWGQLLWNSHSEWKPINTTDNQLSPCVVPGEIMGSSHHINCCSVFLFYISVLQCFSSLARLLKVLPRPLCPGQVPQSPLCSQGTPQSPGRTGWHSASVGSTWKCWYPGYAHGTKAINPKRATTTQNSTGMLQLMQHCKELSWPRNYSCRHVLAP